MQGFCISNLLFRVENPCNVCIPAIHFQLCDCLSVARVMPYILISGNHADNVICLFMNDQQEISLRNENHSKYF